MYNPDDCRFTKSHEWVSADGTVGLSDHAQKEITDVVFVELPAVGKEVKAGDQVAVVESVKAAFDIYSPISGKITKINDGASGNPGAVNASPYGDGWLFTIEQTNTDEAKALMDNTAYQEFIKNPTH